MDKKWKEVVYWIGSGSLVGLLSVMGTIALFWAQDMYIDIDGTVLNWSWMGYPLGYGALTGGAAGLILALIFVRSGVELAKEEILWELAQQKIHDANELIRRHEENKQALEQALDTAKQENLQLRKNIQGNADSINELKEQLTAAEEREKALEDELNTASDNLQAVQQQLADCEQNHAEAQAERDQLQQDLGAAQATVTSLQKENLDLQMALDNATGAPASS